MAARSKRCIMRGAIWIVATAIIVSPASAAGDILGFKKYPVQTYDTFGDPDALVAKDQLGDLSVIEIEGVWASKRLVVLGVAGTQIAVSASEIIAREPDRIAAMLGAAPNKGAVSCFGRPGVARGRQSGAKTRTTKGFGGDFCP